MLTRFSRIELAGLVVVFLACIGAANESKIVDLGSRRGLFIDHLLIGELRGTRLKLHEPQRLPRAAYPPRPTGHYATVLKDGDVYRLYYRGDKIPGAHWRDGWGNRSNHIAWHVVPTSDTEMSMYNVNGDHYVLRTDGFVSVHAGAEEGEFITKPFTCSGDRLEINEATSAAGRIRLEIQDASGQPVPGYTLQDSETIYGDRISHIVTWSKDGAKSPDVSRLAGRPIRLRFVMQEADLFAIRFYEGNRESR